MVLVQEFLIGSAFVAAPLEPGSTSAPVDVAPG
jgi:hypothetical protein